MSVMPGEVGFSIWGGGAVNRADTTRAEEKKQQPDGMSHRGSIEPPQNWGGGGGWD